MNGRYRGFITCNFHYINDFSSGTALDHMAFYATLRVPTESVSRLGLPNAFRGSITDCSIVTCSSIFGSLYINDERGNQTLKEQGAWSKPSRTIICHVQ